MVTKFSKINKIRNILTLVANQKLTFILRLKILFYSIMSIIGISSLYLLYIVILGLYKNLDNKPSLNYKILTRKYDIVDRNGNVLAVTIPSSSLYLRPKDIVDKDLAISSITKVFNISKENAETIVNSKSPFVWVARNVPNSKINEFLKYGVIGSYVERGYSRFYPYGNYFSHVVGITNIDGEGLSGIEYSFNNDLFKHSVQLSLDLRIQVVLREALVGAVKRNNAKGAFGIIVDPHNGEVLALSSVPDFNPNDRVNLNLQNMFNYVTQAVFEQGSTFKLFTIAMALDTKTFSIFDNFDVSKPIVKNGYVLVDNTYIDRKINMAEILIYSSDVGSSLISRQLETDIQKRYLSYMGLFNATTLEIPEKNLSVLPKNWSDLTKITLSYGYGMAVSQATAANAFITLINGGYYVPLTLLKVSNVDTLEKYQVFNADTSEVIRKMGRLVMVHGTGKAADVEGFEVGGKTGTAELIDQKTGNYSMNKVLSTVLAFAPANNPKYLIIMSVEEPQRTQENSWSRVAAKTIAPEVKKVISNIGNLLAIPKSYDNANKVNIQSPEDILYFINSK